MADQTSYSIQYLSAPGSNPGPEMVVQRVATGSPIAEVIQSVTVTQVLQANVGASGKTADVTLIWTYAPTTGTNDLDTVLSDAGWSASPPWLDPTLEYDLSITQHA